MDHLGPHEIQPLPSLSPSVIHTPGSSEDDDVVEPLPSDRMNYARNNPFSNPDDMPRPPSTYSSHNSNTTATQFEERASRYFHSRRIRPGEVEKPWLNKIDSKEKWVTIMPLMAIGFGLILSGLLVWEGLRSVVHHKFCLVLDEDWSNGIDPTIWTKEVEVGGFG